MSTPDATAWKRVTILLRSPRSVRGGVLHLLETLKALGATQATAFNAMASFTGRGPVHRIQDIELVPELPVVVFWVDRAEIVDRVLPQVTALIDSGTVTVDETRVIYQASREVDDLPKTLLVRDVMTRDPFSVRTQARVRDVVDELLQRELRSVPVVAADGRVAGIVTNGDLVRRAGLGARLEVLLSLEPGEREMHIAALADSDLTVQDIMTPAPVTVSEDATIREASRLMLDRHLKRLPVVDSAGRLTGMVSRVDLLRTVATSPAPGAEAAATVHHEPASAPVSRIMTRDVPIVREDAPLPHLVNVVISTRLNRAVVVDAAGRPLGVVSDAELIARLTPEARPGIISSLVHSLPLLHGSEETQQQMRWSHGRTARDFMQPDYVVANREQAIGTVLARMLDRRKKIAVLVDDEGRVEGMVDRRDLLGTLA